MATEGGLTVQQVACERAGQDGARRFGLIATANGHSVYGSAYPADWAPMATFTPQEAPSKPFADES